MANSGSLLGVFFCMTICVGLWGITHLPGKGLVCLALAVRAYVSRSPELFAHDGSFIRQNWRQDGYWSAQGRNADTARGFLRAT